jgi:hypothetical protein
LIRKPYKLPAHNLKTEADGLSSAGGQERIYYLIQGLDTAYAKGLMSPKEYKTLKQNLEKRLMPERRPTPEKRQMPVRRLPLQMTPVKRPPRMRRRFILVGVLISVIAIMILTAIPLFLKTTPKPNLEISNVKLEQETLSITIKNTGTAEAHDIRTILRYSKDIAVRSIEVLKPQESMSITQKLDSETAKQLVGVQSNIVVSCKEGITKTIPFKP